MGFWSIVVPEATSNLIENPSFENNVTDFWSFAQAGAGGSVTQSSAQSRWGAYSAALLADDTTQSLINSDNVSVANNDYVTATIRYYKSTAFETRIYIYDATTPATMATTTDLTATDGWETIELTAQNTTGGAINVSVYVSNRAADNASIVYVDAVQLELKAYATTYCDGTQPGCEWNGTAHAATSTRSALSRAGGRVYDLDDYGFHITDFIDSGVAPLTQHLDEYAIIPGGEVSSYKVHPRVLTLVGFMYDQDCDWAAYHSSIQNLIGILKPDAVPGNQPIRLRYTNATVTKEISAQYEGGLETAYRGDVGPQQKFPVRFLAADPFWYEVGESSVILDTNDSATFRTVGARLRSSGQWDAVGPPAVAGTYGDVYTFAEDSTYIYIGGNFANWDNIPNADNIVRYNKLTGVYSAMGTGATQDVRMIKITQDGRVYAGGAFISMGGVASTRYIAVWNGTSWAALGVGLNATVETIELDLNGDLYIGGVFTDVFGGGGGTYNHIVRWDGAAYNALGVGADATVRALAVSKSSGDMFIGGDFANIAGVAAAYAARWDGTAAYALGSGMNGAIYALAIDNSNAVYAGGSFTTAGGNTANRIAKWNGVDWSPLGTGTDNTVYALAFGPDGILYLSGLFTTAGGLSLNDKLAKWNGSSFAHLDVDWPGVPIGWGILPSQYTDPVLKSKYDLWYGFNTIGTGYYSGTVTHSPPANATEHYPVFYISRSGGTTATVVQIRNETLGQTLLFDYSLLDGETLTIDLRPSEKTITSSYFGRRDDALLEGSDLGTFYLRGGTNQLTAFVSVTGAPTISAYILYRERYWSLD